MASQMKQHYDSVSTPPELNIILPTQMEVGAIRFDWSSDEIQSQLPTDILLITVKDYEFSSCYSYLKLRPVRRSWCNNLGMVDFGKFGERNTSRIALIKCEMGPMPALIIVKNAAEILNPKVILCVGFCATVNPAKAKLGDVVISSKLATYANKKSTANGSVVSHGVKANVSRNMARLIPSANDGWVPPLKDASQRSGVKVHSRAVMLSGPELVRYPARRAELLRHYPDAIGLDMEGEGMRDLLCYITCNNSHRCVDVRVKHAWRTRSQC
jgi:hypothetical protein